MLRGRALRSVARDHRSNEESQNDDALPHSSAMRTPRPLPAAAVGLALVPVVAAVAAPPAAAHRGGRWLCPTTVQRLIAAATVIVLVAVVPVDHAGACPRDSQGVRRAGVHATHVPRSRPAGFWFSDHMVVQNRGANRPGGALLLHPEEGPTDVRDLGCEQNDGGARDCARVAWVQPGSSSGQTTIPLVAPGRFRGQSYARIRVG
jgi:hypothetical protein